MPRRVKNADGKSDPATPAVYATDMRDAAIVYALMKSKGVEIFTLEVGKAPPYGIIFEGWPTQSHVYVHRVLSQTFRKVSHKDREWVSLKAVRPIESERIQVKKVLGFVRKSTRSEKRTLIRTLRNDKVALKIFGATSMRR